VLNIKDPEAHNLAKQLAELEHTSMTEAVTRALRAALDEHGRRRQLRRQVLTALIESARVETDSVAAHSTDSRESVSAFDELYDPETGLPR
jgi:hypothetical protein